MSVAQHARVSFPATETFARLGRVTASGIALRLGIEIGRVEQLRTAVNAAVAALEGEGTIELHADWNDDTFELEISNAQAMIQVPQQLIDEISPLVTDVDATNDSVHLTLDR